MIIDIPDDMNPKMAEIFHCNIGEEHLNWRKKYGWLEATGAVLAEIPCEDGMVIVLYKHPEPVQGKKNVLTSKPSKSNN